jgi:hypothetical protein
MTINEYTIQPRYRVQKYRVAVIKSFSVDRHGFWGSYFSGLIKNFLVNVSADGWGLEG